MKRELNFDYVLFIIALLIVAAFLFFCNGCYTVKQCKQFCVDSVSVQHTYIPLQIPVYYEDSSLLKIWLDCDSAGNVYYTNWQQVSGKNTELQAKLDNNVATIKYKTVYKAVIDTFIKDTVIFKQITKEVERKKTSVEGFWNVMGKVGLGLIVFLIVAFVVYIYMKFRGGLFKNITKQ